MILLLFNEQICQSAASSIYLYNILLQVILMAEEQESIKKFQRILLDLNKNGLSYLTTNSHSEAIEYFKQAQKAITQELKINPHNAKVNQLAGITYNNLACYYKKNNKPKVALSYLKKALQIQVYKVEDWTSTASTHLNICAIYSYLNKHQQSADHAELALNLLQKVDVKNLKESQIQGEKSYYNIKMLTHYNFAIQLQHLKQYDQARIHYKKAKETAEENKQKNHNIIHSIQESLQRVNGEDQSQKKRLLQILAKRKIQQQKGNYQFMRKNKKNYGDQAEWKSIAQNKKYELYKTQHDTRKQYQSTEKVRKLVPINDGSRSKRGLQPM